jgi:hypothetical protein
VNGRCESFLADTRLSKEQYGRGRRRNLTDLLEHSSNRLTLAGDDVFRFD